MDIIFDLGGGLAPMGAEHLATEKPTAFITGTSIKPAVIALPEIPRIIGIRFRPGGILPLLHTSAIELAETSTPLDDTLPSFNRLATALAGEIAKPRRMAQRIDRLLREKLPASPKSPAPFRNILRAMKDQIHGGTSRPLTELTGISQKQLERLCKHHTGLTPKRMLRTARFVESLQAMQSNQFNSLADLSLALGFSDQAHFNRDFKRLSGLTPTEWMRERSCVDFLQYTPLRPV